MSNYLSIIDILLKGVIAFSAIAISYILIAFYLPRILLRPKCDTDKMSDRGIKKYVYEDGRGILYEPEIAARRYVKQYIIFTKDGAKYFKCFTVDHVRHIKYDVLAFDNKNKLIEVLSVDELLRGANMTKALALPEATSYVSFALRSADNMYIGTTKILKFSYLFSGIYAAVSALCIAISGYAVNSFLRVMFTGSRIKYLTDAEAFIKCLLIGLAFGGISMLLYATKYRREIN